AKVSEHSPEAWASRHEEAGLLRRHRAGWLGRLEKITSRVTFDRGFPDDVVVGVAQFAKNADALFSLTPVRRLQILRISQTKLTMADLAAIDGMKRLRGLSVRNSTLGDDLVAELLTALHMPHLAELDLTGTALEARALAALRKADLPRLRTLSLANNYAVTTAAQVAGAVAGRALTALDLSQTYLNGEEVGLLADWPGLASLTRLDLGTLSAGVRGSTRLFASPHLGRLTHLGLSSADIRHGGAAALARCERLAGLRSLDVSACMLEPRGLENLLAGPHLRGLERLDLASNGLDASCMRALAEWPGLTPVRSLRLAFNLIGNLGLGYLLDGPNLGALTSLDACNCDLRQGVGKLLGSSKKLASLAQIDLSYNAYREADAVALIESEHLLSLTSVKGSAVKIGPEVLARWQERFPE
ncbi:MAG: hypothetical protein ACRC33_10200, partial [Gemmataceae bacterium]